jgi:hypothetical protein
MTQHARSLVPLKKIAKITPILRLPKGIISQRIKTPSLFKYVKEVCFTNGIKAENKQLIELYVNPINKQYQIEACSQNLPFPLLLREKITSETIGSILYP